MLHVIGDILGRWIAIGAVLVTLGLNFRINLRVRSLQDGILLLGLCTVNGTQSSPSRKRM